MTAILISMEREALDLQDLHERPRRRRPHKPGYLAQELVRSLAERGGRASVERLAMMLAQPDVVVIALGRVLEQRRLVRVVQRRGGHVLQLVVPQAHA